MSNLGPEIIVPCSCSCGVIRMVKDEEDNELYISVYRHHPDISSWKEKLRWIWAVLKNNVFEDEIVLNKEDSQKLKKFFKDNV